jgi:dynein heavy chain
LETISRSDESVVDDDVLVDLLESSVKTAKEIREKQAESKTVEDDIDKTRDKFVPVAVRASLLFFAITDLS